MNEKALGIFVYLPQQSSPTKFFTPFNLIGTIIYWLKGIVQVFKFIYKSFSFISKFNLFTFEFYLAI